MKETLNRKEGIVDVVMTKALDGLWPEDVHNAPIEKRWNVESFEPFTDDKTVVEHLYAQFVKSGSNEEGPLHKLRAAIGGIFFGHAMARGVFTFKLECHGNGRMECCCWNIRTHLPIRVSPQGTPLIVVSAMDFHHTRRHGLKDHDKTEAKDIFLNGLTKKQSRTAQMPLETIEEAHLLVYILRYNSVKMEPTAWQKENFPQGESNPWLATFLQPLYLDSQFEDESDDASSSACAKCKKDTSGNPKRCSRCKAVSYCSVECQRADWTKHKLSCSKE